MNEAILNQVREVPVGDVLWRLSIVFEPVKVQLNDNLERTLEPVKPTFVGFAVRSALTKANIESMFAELGIKVLMGCSSHPYTKGKMDEEASKLAREARRQEQTVADRGDSGAAEADENSHGEASPGQSNV